MQRNNQLTIDGRKPFREFVLDEPEPSFPAHHAKQGLFATVFYGLIYPVKEILQKSLFISITSLSLLETFQQFKANIRRQNKNLSSLMNTLLGVGLFALECLAVTAAVFGVIGGVIFAPKIFMCITGFKTLQSLIAMTFHLFHIGKHYYNKYFNELDETFTYEHQSHVKAFKENLKGLFLNGILFLGVTFGFFFPAVYPAVLASAAMVTTALAVKWTVVATYATAAVIGLAPTLYSGLKSLCSYVKNKIKPKPQPLDTLEESWVDQPESVIKLYSNHLDPMQQAMYLQANKYDNLNTNHIDDLLVKIEVLSGNGSQNPFYNAKSFVLDLLEAETLNIKNGNKSKPVEDHCKYQVIVKIRILLEGGKLNLRYNGAKYDDTIFGLVRYYHDRGEFSDVAKSRLKSIGGMQKLLVVAHHYFELNPLLIEELPHRKEATPVFTSYQRVEKRLPKKHRVAYVEKPTLVGFEKTTGEIFKPKHRISSNIPIVSESPNMNIKR